MTLANYITKVRRISWYAFAKEVGVAYTTAHRLKKGATCSIATAKKIETWSGGKVKAAELVGLHRR